MGDLVTITLHQRGRGKNREEGTRDGQSSRELETNSSNTYTKCVWKKEGKEMRKKSITESGYRWVSQDHTDRSHRPLKRYYRAIGPHLEKEDSHCSWKKKSDETRVTVVTWEKMDSRTLLVAKWWWWWWLTLEWWIITEMINWSEREKREFVVLSRLGQNVRFFSSGLTDKRVKRAQRTAVTSDQVWPLLVEGFKSWTWIRDVDRRASGKGSKKTMG